MMSVFDFIAQDSGVAQGLRDLCRANAVAAEPLPCGDCTDGGYHSVQCDGCREYVCEGHRVDADGLSFCFACTVKSMGMTPAEPAIVSGRAA